MLKAEPLTVLEVNTYGVGHINRYTSESIETAYDQNGYGGMAYYTSETCGFPIGSYTYAGCITDYSQSEIKYVVDAWASDKASDAIEYWLSILNSYFSPYFKIENIWPSISKFFKNEPSFFLSKTSTPKDRINWIKLIEIYLIV